MWRSVPSAVLASALLSIAGCGTLPRASGPLPVRNQHPAQLLAPHLEPVSANVLASGEALVSVQSTYTSLWLTDESQPNGSSLVLDGELWRPALDVRFGLGGDVELEAELPFGYATGGGLDSFVIEWHDLFGFPDQGRDDRARDDFRVAAAHEGRTAYALEPHELQLADLPIGVRLRVLGDDRTALAVRANVELPTGDEDAGYGNGGWDTALGLVGELHAGDFAFVAHGHYAFVHTSEPAARAGLELRDVAAAGLAASWRIVPGFELHVQTQWETSVLRGLGFERAADDQWLLWTGFRAACSDRVFLEVALGEDIGPFVSPDFSVWAALGARF